MDFGTHAHVGALLLFVDDLKHVGTFFWIRVVWKLAEKYAFDKKNNNMYTVLEVACFHKQNKTHDLTKKSGLVCSYIIG